MARRKCSDRHRHRHRRDLPGRASRRRSHVASRRLGDRSDGSRRGTLGTCAILCALHGRAHSSSVPRSRPASRPWPFGGDVHTPRHGVAAKRGHPPSSWCGRPGATATLSLRCLWMRRPFHVLAARLSPTAPIRRAAVRHGGLAKLLGEVRAPSTLGTLLWAFNRGICPSARAATALCSLPRAAGPRKCRLRPRSSQARPRRHGSVACPLHR